MTSLLGFGRRCHLASFAFLLASSLDFLQGTFEKIHLHGLLRQQPLQLMDLLSVRRFMRVRPRCFFSWLEVIEFALSLVETPSAHSQFFRQIANVVAASHALNGHPLKLPRVSFPLHFAVLSLQSVPIPAVSFQGCSPQHSLTWRASADACMQDRCAATSDPNGLSFPIWC
jgi:hypothetical protein